MAVAARSAQVVRPYTAPVAPVAVGTPAAGPARRLARGARPGPATRVLGTLLTAAGLLLAVGVREAQIASLGYRTWQLRQQLAAEQAAVERLEAERAQLSSPERLDAVARFGLGLVPAHRVALRRVEPLVPVAAAESTQPARLAVVPLVPATAGVREPEERGALLALSRWLYRWLAGVQPVEARTLDAR